MPDPARVDHSLTRTQLDSALKAAFVQGRLTKDEFDQRVGQVLATYAELDALTADIPVGPTQTQLSAPARESHNRKVIQGGTAAGAGASMAFTAAMVVVADSAIPRPQTGHDPRHTAEAEPSRYAHWRTSGAAVQGA
jgi:hypothetical protein